MRACNTYCRQIDSSSLARQLWQSRAGPHAEPQLLTLDSWPQVTGGWSQKVAALAYAKLPTSDSLANRAGHTRRDTVMVFHHILDPALIPEFAEMVGQLFLGADQLLADLQKVGVQLHYAWTPELDPQQTSLQEVRTTSIVHIAGQSACMLTCHQRAGAILAALYTDQPHATAC